MKNDNSCVSAESLVEEITSEFQFCKDLFEKRPDDKISVILLCNVGGITYGVAEIWAEKGLVLFFTPEEPKTRCADLIVAQPEQVHFTLHLSRGFQPEHREMGFAEIMREHKRKR